MHHFLSSVAVAKGKSRHLVDSPGLHDFGQDMEPQTAPDCWAATTISVWMDVIIHVFYIALFRYSKTLYRLKQMYKTTHVK